MDVDVPGYSNSLADKDPVNSIKETVENILASVTTQIENSDSLKNGQNLLKVEDSVSSQETEISTNTGHRKEQIENDAHINSQIEGEKNDRISEEDKHLSSQITEQKEEEKISEAAEEKEKEEEWLDILGSGQLKKKIVKKAENSYRPQRSHICEINLEGCLPDGTIVDKHEHLSLQIGDVEVIQGLDLALPLMDVGEVALLEVGPRFAYGSQGCEPSIPPDTTIMYTVELLSAEPEPEIETLSAAKRKEIGCRKRERGNWWYTRQEQTLAIQCYRRALDYLDGIEGGITLKSEEEEEESLSKGLEQEVQDLLEDRLKVYNNLAAAQMKIKAYDTALQSVENVLRCQPQNVKALFRKGKILAAKGEHSNSVKVLRLASQLEPENRMVRQELLRMLTLHKEDTAQEKNLYKKMLGQDKRPDSLPRNNKLPWSVLIGAFVATVAGVVTYRYKFS